MNTNYNKEMKNIISNLTNKPKLLLHICCAPCTSGVLVKLVPFFDVSILFYNPNISLKEEYDKRKQEFIKFNKDAGFRLPIINCEYDPQEFNSVVKGLEKEPEGGKRCEKCFELRLTKTAIIAIQNSFDYFATTLTVSPYKNADKINTVGKMIEEKINANNNNLYLPSNNISKYLYYLPSDFKKENGYLNSIINSNKYGLYRQDYCGCIYSYNEKIKNKNNMNF